MSLTVWMFPKFNPTNKYNELFVSSLEKEEVKVNEFSFRKMLRINRGDIIHFHWIDSFYQKKNKALMIVSSIVFFLLLYILKLRGVKLVWTIHNLYPHNYIWLNLEKKIRAKMMNICDILIVAANSIKQEVIKEFGINNPEKIKILFHGHYKDIYPIKGINYREKYNIESNNLVFLFVGAIKEYKGVVNLLKNFTKLGEDKVSLIIAGKVYDGLEDTISQYKNKRGVILDLRFIPNEDLADLILSSDYVILPFKNITTSGSAILAASLRRKIICPDTPFMEEYFNKSLAILYNIEDSNGLFHALTDCLNHPQNKEISEEAYHQFLNRLDWNRIGVKMKNMYQSL